tara:strand:+ start:935 stop:1141 length:207 start_codon:yes stop_codon:yes gene_type:complete
MIHTTISTYKNIKVIKTCKSTIANPIAKITTIVFVDGKIVTKQNRYKAEELIDNANVNDVKTTFEIEK